MGLNALDRRTFLGALAGAGAALRLRAPAFAADGPILTRPIPKTGEQLPAVGMGSWLTFNVGHDPDLRNARAEVLRTFFNAGGAVVDSSPMYGSSEEVIGYCLERIGKPNSFFSATKVWTPFQAYGVLQMNRSIDYWHETPFDLFQIHNLLNWESHMETLLEWKAAGRVRYIGITTSHGRRHEAFERVMTSQPIDFVQFTYNLRNRAAERRLLPVAAERGLAVIINRPFRHGALFDDVAGKPLPKWAGAFGIENWAQFFLKFIVSHPAVTCAIPATRRVDHMTENMGALRGALPDPATRRRMIAAFEEI
jgi:diketogulonate reductase-like aldo/keto reductase